MSDSTDQPDKSAGDDHEGAVPPGDAPTMAQDGSGVSDKPAPTPPPPRQDPAADGPGAVTEKAGDSIGPYKLLQPIGEGGFGVVYMAEQSAPVKRRVALKIIKPGMDTKEVIARFEAERQALALMNHPHIARVLDAGTTDTGRPFFAMELVKGVSITDYCDTQRLDTRQRLQLFRDVCGAVQHAHQKGVIHRDLKPSNILVTLHDGEPVVKVIDFGIAKAISQELTEKTLFTAFGQMIGTPQYMSPEQSEISGLDVDTRSDIYSLGVVLYELLTGRTPIDPQQLRQAGLDEIHRLIREQEPPKPSTRLTSLENDEITAIAKAHREPPDKLSRLVRGDLDWIVMKALEKDRTRRYETATGFADDIRRYLDDEPVLASPPSATYRLGKFARRNKAALVTASAILVILIAAVAVSTWQALEAIEAREAEAEQRELAEANAREAAEKATEAEQSAEEAKTVLAFFEDKVLAAARPKEEGGLGFDATIKEAIEVAEPQIGQAFADRPLVEASVRSAVAETYLSLGLAKIAVSQYERALELRQQLLGPEHWNTRDSMSRLAVSYRDTGRFEEAITLQEETLELQKKLLGPEHRSTLYSAQNLAQFYQVAGRIEEAIALQEETLALQKRLLGPEHPATLLQMLHLGISYSVAGRYHDALALQEETLELQKNLLGPEHPHTVASMINLAGSYANAGRHDEALALREETLKLQKKLLGPEHPYTLVSMNNLASTYRNTGQHDKALDLQEKTLELQKMLLGPEHPDTLTSMNGLAISYNSMARHDEAVKLFNQTLELRKRVLGPEHPDTLKTMCSLSGSCEDAGRQDDAIKWYAHTFELCKKVLGIEHSDTLSSISGLAYLYWTVGRFEDAESLFREWVAIRKKQGASDWRFFYTQSSLGWVLTEQKKYDEAEPLLLAGYEGLKLTAPKEEPKWLRFSLERLVDLYTDWGKPEEAAKWQAKLEAEPPKTEPAAPKAPEFHTFTDVFGQQTEARIIKVENGQVVLEQRDGKQLILPLKSLSAEERQAVADFESAK